ncbi:MAG: diacylglycerol kinase family protein [Phycisphaerales bacterium]
MKFGMIVNPMAGPTNAHRKAQSLHAVQAILGDCEIRGLETTSREEFMQCAAELAREVEILIVAGGDGSFSDAINALNSETTFSYLPFGSGCAMRYALDLPPQLTRVAKRIREGRLRRYDLILCDGVRKGFMTSVGLEADIIHRREALRDSGINGPQAYAMATFGSFFTELERTDMSIRLDGEELAVPNAVTAIVTKIPYYGYKMKIVPNAVFDDGRLHLLAINSGWAEIVGGVANAFLYENKMGIYKTARDIRITTQRERYAQVDGNIYRKGTSFEFKVLPQALRVWC